MKVPAAAAWCLLAVTACGGAPAGQAGGSSPSAEPIVHLTVSYSNVVPDNLPLWIAKDAGIFKAHRLDVDVQLISSTTGMPALLSGQTQFADIGGSEALSAAAAGGDVVVLANLTPVAPYIFYSAPAITDALGGHVPMLFDSTVAIVPQLKAGKLRPIAISGAKRSPLLPDVPTFAEAGLPGVESYAWYGFFGRAGTPKEIIDKLNAEAIKVMKGPDFKNVYAETGSEFVGDTPANFARFIQAEAAKWAKVVKDSGATVD